MDNFEQEAFLILLLREVAKVCSSWKEAVERSILFFLYQMFLERSPSKWKHFYLFIQRVQYIGFAMRDNSELELDEEELHVMFAILDSKYAFILNPPGCFLFKEMRKVMKYKVIKSIASLIYGLKFRSRGFHCRDTENSIDQINTNWEQPAYYSCWCKFRGHVNGSEIVFRDWNPTTNMYGYLNFFSIELTG
jgi:hypothetical protein